MICAFCGERRQEGIPLGITENRRDHALCCRKVFDCNGLGFVVVTRIAPEAATPRASKEAGAGPEAKRPTERLQAVNRESGKLGPD